MDEICRWTAIQTADEIKQGNVSVVEVTEAHLARLEKINPSINAITTTVAEALDTARQMDSASDEERSKPLFGVPATSKINVDQVGYPNSNGIPAFNEILSSEDSPVVSNMKRAGMNIIGRTNTPEFSMRWCTSNPLHGVTTNPWNAEVTPGGSSGAAAAATLCGIGAIAHGNDLGGSLRYPAYCCGIASIRPSFGRVPASKPSAGAERPPITQTMSVQGPIAKTVRDVKAALTSMAAPDSRDPLWVNAPKSGKIKQDAIKVGYTDAPFGEDTPTEIRKAIQLAVKALQDTGVTCTQVDLPYATECARLWGELLFTETSIASLPAIRETASAEMNATVSAYLEVFPPLDAAGLIEAMTRRIAYQRAWSQMLDEYDLVLLPTSMMLPFENDLDFKDPSKIPAILDAMRPLCMISALGLPSVAIPTHVSDTGIPVGVQLVGAMHDDFFALDVASKIEDVIGTIWQELPLWNSN